MTWYRAEQFALVRIALGAFLAAYGCLLLPHAGELLGSEGMLAHWGHGFRWFPRALPSPLEGTPSLVTVYAMLALVIASGAALALGAARRAAAVAAWYGVACLLARNPSLINPAMPFVGWLCLATVIVPQGEGWSVRQRRADPGWTMPPALFHSAWIVMAVAYSFSGLVKLTSPAWVDGSALGLVLDTPFARDGWGNRTVAALPELVLHGMTWLTLIGEIAFAPLCLHRYGRILAWVVMAGMHVVLLLTMAFPELTMAMFLIHAFTFDARWTQRFPRRSPARHRRGDSTSVDA